MRPTLEPACCHLWLADIKALTFQLADFERNLSAAEVSRANRFVNDQLRSDFVLAHGWMRRVLAEYTGQKPVDLQFLDNGYGKPSLMVGDLRFNLSHSAGRVVLALCGDAEIGVDVQFMGGHVDMLGIAQRFFAKEEHEWLESTPEGLRRDVFYQVWSLKEAYIKAIGLGMSLSLQDFAFGIDGDMSVCLLRQPEKYIKASYRGHVLDHDDLQDYALAVVAPASIDHFLFC